MAEIRDFRDLIVWRKSNQLFLSLAREVKRFPEGIAGRIVIDQVLRSSGSISANIAEGFGRRKGREYVHYLIVSRGSLMETLNWLLKCRDLNWLSDETYERYEALIEEIMKVLNKMIGQRLTH